MITINTNIAKVFDREVEIETQTGYLVKFAPFKFVYVKLPLSQGWTSFEYSTGREFKPEPLTYETRKQFNTAMFDFFNAPRNIARIRAAIAKFEVVNFSK